MVGIGKLGVWEKRDLGLKATKNKSFLCRLRRAQLVNGTFYILRTNENNFSINYYCQTKPFVVFIKIKSI